MVRLAIPLVSPDQRGFPVGSLPRPSNVAEGPDDGEQVLTMPSDADVPAPESPRARSKSAAGTASLVIVANRLLSSTSMVRRERLAAESGRSRFGAEFRAEGTKGSLDWLGRRG